MLLSSWIIHKALEIGEAAEHKLATNFFCKEAVSEFPVQDA